ncbi:C-X-C chemokine receptor type 1 [Tachysurus vachellii]|uniref:C-X-C chemokine receptor type 1 n=1 Tax=Tachysurus vachellii TaxID=175792 RepID=UPI00296B171D|nr:C-X-C chemokine receptor type 1 [Tachysurus vachellii]
MYSTSLLSELLGKDATMTDLNMSLLLVDFSEFYDLEFNNSILNVTYNLDETTIVCQEFTISLSINIAVCVLFVHIFLLAIPGNLIVGLVILSNLRFLSPSDIYLFHLVIADILMALTLPFFSTSVVAGWIFGDIMCKLVNLVKEANFYTSILFLVCISVDRYMVIVRAMEARKVQRIFCSWAVCFVVWILGVLLSLPALYNEVHYITDKDLPICAERFEFDSSDEWRIATRVMRHLLGFLLPLCVMLTCYGVTVARLLRTRGFQRQRAMKLIAAVIVAFLLCWTPFNIATMVDTLMRANLVRNDCSAKNGVSLAMFITQSLGLLHCSVNPLLYAFVGEKFRMRFFNMIHRTRKIERFTPSRSTRSTSQSSEGVSHFL